MSEPDPENSGIFPDQIVTEILTRLPVKSICISKCVSKRWLSLTSNPHFLTSYIPSLSWSWAIMDRIIRVIPGPCPTDPTQILNLSLVGPPDVTSLSITTYLADPPEQSSREDGNFPAVISGSNGLLLLACVKGKRDPYLEYKKNPTYFSHRTSEDGLVVCNPITRHWVKIPKPSKPLNHRGCMGFSARVGPSGAVERFVVVEFRPLIGSEKCTIWTFSSEVGKWEKKYGNYMLGMHFWRSEGAFESDGRFFWIDLSCGLITWEDDPFNRSPKAECGFIALPEGCVRPFNTPELNSQRKIGVSGGHIQFMEVCEGLQPHCELRLWRLKNCKGREWDLVYKVCLSEIWSDQKYLGCVNVANMMPAPVLFHPFKADVVFFEVGNRLVSVNVGTKKVLSCDVYSSQSGYMCLVPFVIPGWPSSLPPDLTAASVKDLGNEHFKEKKFDEAIRCYSSSIARSPTAAAYANRAAAYLKISKYVEAESDCTEALKLDEQYMKAYARRAIARKELGKLSEAKEDVEICLKLEPQQEEILKQYSEINYLLEMVTVKRDGNEVGGATQS